MEPKTQNQQKTVGILYICTGRYTVFWPDFYKTFEEKFLPACHKEYFVFTDAPALEFEESPAVHRLYQKGYDWPLSTLKRFSVFLQAEEQLKAFDYLFFANANLLCLEPVSEEEFLPRADRGEELLVIQHPGYWNKTPPFFAYDRNPKSTAYVPYNCGQYYVLGGLNGGTAPAFLALCHELERRIENDLSRDVIALWHDESQLNRYIAEQTGGYRLLGPAYCYPEGWALDFPKKIIVREKSKWIDVGAVKGHQKPQNFFQRKWGAFCENYLPLLYARRDALLHKTL